MARETFSFLSHIYKQVKIEGDSFFMSSKYLKMLSKMGIGGAHPGGFPLTKHVIDGIELPLTSHILDVGCGTGQTLKYLYELGYNASGIDIDLNMVKKAKKRFHDENTPMILKADLCDLELRLKKFDVVISESVLAFTQIEKSLLNIFQLLKKDGILIANEMCVIKELTNFEKKELQMFYGFKQFLSLKEWQLLLKKHHFSLIDQIGKDEINVSALDTTTEFELDPSISTDVFDIMDQHEQLTSKYAKKLDYRVFICQKITN